ncbi:MAG: hypothetical protein V7K48_34730 [Nostoc sp.]|uniref:hypothetical protein n=1 Tax=Nostoc sp. TaxID=1180 RepID=UPI002FFBBB42
MSDNPRQFSSIDSSDANLHGSLTNRPSTGAPISNPTDLTAAFEENRRLEAYQKQKGTFVERSSDVEKQLLKEQQDALDAAFRQQVKESKAAQELQSQREQAQRIELMNRVKGDASTPHPYDVETERNTVRRLMRLPPVDEPPTSTANTAIRQPPPSTGRPPPTPNGTAARASPLVEPTATPAPAGLAEPVPSPTGGGGGGSLFSSLPTPVGRAIVPGAIAAVNFADRVVHGQPITQAATGAVATSVGTVAGGLVGEAIAGPVGGFVGGLVGGYIGGAIADSFWSQPPPGTAHLERNTPNYPPFPGGQSVGVFYTVTCGFSVFQKGNPRTLATEADNTVLGHIRGPIQFIGLINNSPEYNPGLLVIGTNEDGSQEIQTAGYGYYTITEVDFLRNLKVRRSDGYLDPTPDIQKHAPPPDNEPYRYTASPIGNNSTVPSGTPSAGLKNGKTKNVAPSMPGNNTPNPAPFFPGHGGLAPNKSPNPTQTPSNLGGNLPGVSPNPTPTPSVEKQNVPPPRSVGSSSGGSSSGGSSPGGSSSGESSPGGSSNRNGVTVTPATVTPATVTLAEVQTLLVIIFHRVHRLRTIHCPLVFLQLHQIHQHLMQIVLYQNLRPSQLLKHQNRLLPIKPTESSKNKRKILMNRSKN